MLTLIPSLRRDLRAKAHTLHPVVAIGHSGLTPSVLHEIDVALAAHELVKVRVHSDDRDERERFLAEICNGLDAGPVQHLGKLLIVWRPKPKAEREEERRPRATKGKAKAGRRGDRPSAKAAPAHRGPPEPKVGPRASKHRRGASRHDPDAPPFGAGATSSRRRTTRAPAPEPVVPTTSARRGARYSEGKPVGPKGRRPAATPKGKRGAASDARPTGKRGAASGTRTSGKRVAASDAGTGGTPAATRRRRRPTGGR